MSTIACARLLCVRVELSILANSAKDIPFSTPSCMHVRRWCGLLLSLSVRLEATEIHFQLPCAMFAY